MSGIAGVWNLDGRNVELPLLARIGAALAHRGQDCSDTRCDRAMGFAQLTRVSYESAAERQPFCDERGNAVVFDGRIDNRAELLSQIDARGVTTGTPDSALILHAFLRWGHPCLCRLNGDFALAIFDARQQRMILARDPLGCRPLYYWRKGARFVFASEIKAVLAHPEVPPKPNHDLIADYFLRDRLPYEDPGETFFQDVYAVLPGQSLTVSGAGIASTTFWNFDPEAIVRFPSYSNYAERLRELLFQAVRRRLRTLHPVAVAVSGGLDSSIVLCVADQLRKQGACSVPLLPVSLTPVSAATHLGAIENTSDEERSLALLELTTGLRIERLPLGAPGDRADLEAAAWYSEWPRFDDAWSAQRPLFEWAHAQGARTLMTGHWSDQVSFVTGYLSDLFVRLTWREIGRHLRQYPRWFVDADPRYFRNRFRRELAFNLTSHRVRGWMRRFVPERRVVTRDGLLAPDVAARLERPRQRPPRPRCRSAHARDIYQTVRAQAHRLQVEADIKLASSWGLTWTTPFLDRDLVAFLMGIPGEIQNRAGVPRSLLRDSMRGIVPDLILQRRWANEDDVTRAREADYLARTWTLDTAYALGLLQRPFRLQPDTLEFVALEAWSRVFFSDRLTSLRPPPDGVCEAMETADPAPNDDHDKLPYSPPKLTVHGDLRTITAAKQSDRSEAGQPKTFSSGMP